MAEIALSSPSQLLQSAQQTLATPISGSSRPLATDLATLLTALVTVTLLAAWKPTQRYWAPTAGVIGVIWILHYRRVRGLA